MPVSKKFIQSAFQVAAAGVGALIAGPLGGALGGFLGDALGATLGAAAADLTKDYAKKFGEEAGKKLYEIGVDTVSEKLKDRAPKLASLYREALRRSLVDIKTQVNNSYGDWFHHWDTCLNVPGPLELGEFRPDQLDASKLAGFLRQTMETLDSIGAAYEQKSPSIKLQTRTMPDSLYDELMKLLSVQFKEHFDALISDPSNHEARNAADLIFQDWLKTAIIDLGKTAGRIEDNTKALLDAILPLTDKELVKRIKQLVEAETPHEIPSPAADFTNRAADLQDLLLAAAESRTILIFGEPGLGKTELARRFAAEIGKDYPDGQVYFDLRGTSKSPVPPNDLLSYLIQKFSRSHPGATDVALSPIDVEQLATRYTNLMSGKRVLLFLDNVADSEQINKVGPPSACLLLLTAHRKLVDLAGLTAKGIKELPLFSQPDSEMFLRTSVPTIGQHAAGIATLCGGLPFALRKAAGTLAARPDKDPADYAQDLSKNLKTRYDLAQSVIATSYDLLSPPELRQQWCSLSCFVDPFTRKAMEAIWNLPADSAELVIDSLMRSSLLHWDQARRRYYLHDLDRTFAQVNLEKAQPYLRRHAKYFFEQVLSQRHPLELLDPLTNEVFSAYAFCKQEQQQREIDSVIPVVREILNADEIKAASAAYLIARLFKRKHHFAEAQALYETCRQVAVRAGSVSLEGACLRSMGEIHWILGNQPDANEYCRRAIERLSSKESRKAPEEAYKSQKELIFTLHLNSERYLRNGSLSESEKVAQESLEIRDQISPKEREPLAGLSNGAIKVIAFQFARGDLDGAKKLLDLERGNWEGISLASTLGQVGCAMGDAGRYSEAEGLFGDALRAYEGNDVGTGWIHRCMVELELRRGNFSAARDHVQQALSICGARGTQAYEAYQFALTLIAAMRYYYLVNDTKQIDSFAPRLAELYKQIEQSDPSSKRKVAFAIAGLEETLSSCGRVDEAGLARDQRARFEASIQKEEAPSSEVESLADRWGCDALSLAWPGQLLRLLSPRRPANGKAEPTI